MKKLGGKDDNLELIEEFNRQHVGKKIYQTIVRLSLFIYRVDVFSIYKRSNRLRNTQKYHLHQSESLRMELTNTDRWRERWQLIGETIIIYYCIKCSAIILVQVALHLDQFDDEQESDWLALISHLLGNPLIDYTGMTIFLYSVYLACLSYAILYLPYYYRTQPTDSPNIRSWLEPAREFRRLDLSLLEELKKYGQASSRSCYCSHRRSRHRHSHTSQYKTQFVSTQIQAQVINWFRLHHWHLRPITFSLAWHRKLYWFVVLMTIPIGSLFCVSIHFIAQYLLGVSSQLVLGHSIFQQLTFIETTCGLLLVIPTLLLLIMMFFVDCYSQLHLLQDIKHYLLRCLQELHQLGANERFAGASQCKKIEQLTVICSLLKPLVRILLSLDEMRSNAKTLTEMVSVNMVVSGTTCVFILLAENLDGHDLYLLRVMIMVGLWCWTNLILLGCAYVFNSATKLDKITWSLLAELRHRESDKHGPMVEFQMAEHWRRLVLSQCFSDPRLAVRCFGATLNYDRALQLNFLALSFAVLLKSF